MYYIYKYYVYLPQLVSPFLGLLCRKGHGGNRATYHVARLCSHI